MPSYQQYVDDAKARGISQGQIDEFLADHGEQDAHRLLSAFYEDTSEAKERFDGDSGNARAANPYPSGSWGLDPYGTGTMYPGVGAGGSGSGAAAASGGWFAANAPDGGASYGAVPAPFSETYTPGEWTETFAAPAKPSVLQTPYALPTQADLEASPGYLAGQDAMQRGMERSAAARGSILSGGFVGRALPRALGEYAGTAYGNLVNQTLGARQQQYGEYTGDVSNAFQQYQQRYGQFNDAEARKLGGYQTRYGAYMDQNALKRQAETDVWNRNAQLSDLSLRAAALARP